MTRFDIPNRGDTFRKVLALSLAVLVLVGSIGWLPLGGAAAQTAGPDLGVTVDDEAVSAGERYPVDGDPPIGIDAQASEGAEIDLVVVEIDGSVYREYEPNTESFSEQLEPELSSGEYDVEIIVRDTTGTITDIQFAIRKDISPPHVWLTAPYETEPRRSIPNGTVDEVAVTFEGQIDEATGPTHLRISRAHEGTGRTEVVEGTHSGDTFSHEIDLGLGENHIQIMAEDDLGNLRGYEFWVSVSDDEPPDVSMSAPRQTAREDLTVEFTVTDNVWVNRSTFRTETYTAPDMITASSYDPNEDRRSVTFTRHLTLQEGENQLWVWAEDSAGNEVEKSFTIERTEGTVDYRSPEITIDREGTGFSASQTLHADGSITGTELTSATIETRTDGERLDYKFLHRDDPVNRIPIDTLVSIGPGETTVVVRAEDKSGNTTQTEFLVRADDQEIRFDDTEVESEDSDEEEPTAAVDGSDTNTVSIDERPQDTSQATVLLDQGRQAIGAATIGDREYAVYRVENTLPYASGVEVYRDGELVTEEEEVDRVLSVVAAEQVLTAEGYDDAVARASAVTTADAARGQFEKLAWGQAVDQVDQSDIEAMRETVVIARDIQQMTGSMGSAIDGILGFVGWMQETGIAGVTVWDLAVQTSPQLEPFVDNLEALRGELREWEQEAAAVTSTLPTAIESIERAQDGENVDYDRVGSDLSEAMNAMEGLQSKSTDLRNRIQDIAETSSELGRVLGEVDVYGGRLSSKFSSFGSFMSDQANQIGEFENRLDSQSDQLNQIQSSAAAEQDRLYSEWQAEHQDLKGEWAARQDADSKVKLSLGGGTVVVASGLGFVLWRRVL